MKKRPDEKFSLLNKIGNYKLKIDMLQSLYFKSQHKKHQIVLWMHHPKDGSN